MPIAKIRRATRYIARYREIFSVLVRYGLADWAKRIDVDFAREILTRNADPALLSLSTPERIRRALVELGPTFIKFGQMLSLRPDIAGVELADELKSLQSRVPPDPFDVVERTIREELGAPLGAVFKRFAETPVASASIGQVHRATLLTGREVAVKVRHQGVEQTIAADLDILRDLAELAEDYVEESRHFQPRETVDRFARTLTRELDFMREARHMINLAEELEGERFVKIPEVYEPYTRSRVLVMEWIDGLPLSSASREYLESLDTATFAEQGAEVFLKMIFVDGFYHADPHPGNLMIVDGGQKMALLDFGMVGRLSARMREHIEEMVGAVAAKDSEKLVRVITKAGSLPPDFNEAALAADLTDFISYYGALPVSKIKLSESIAELMSIIHRHHVILASEIVLLLRTLLTLEGTGRVLSADFNLLSMVMPYQQQLNASAMMALRKLAKARRFYEEMADFVETVPPALADIVNRFRKGTIEIHMEHKKLERSVNRLVFGVLTAAIFMGSSMVLAASVPPVLFGLSVFGVTGYVVSLAMGVRLLWSIMVADKLD